MAIMTSAIANKMMKKMTEDKEYLRNKEQEGYLYIAALDETPVIPDYNYSEVAAQIDEIDEKIIKIKHVINVVNATNEIEFVGRRLTVDAVLVRMAQLNKRKVVLDDMRKRAPQTRINNGGFMAKKTSPEYQYINYDLDLIKSEYERIDAEISAMQIALDKFNQTFEFEVEI